MIFYAAIYKMCRKYLFYKAQCIHKTPALSCLSDAADFVFSFLKRPAASCYQNLEKTNHRNYVQNVLYYWVHT